MADTADTKGQAPGRRPVVATASFAGCFGCHMSFLDIDERFVELVDKIDFGFSPLVDTKTVGPCDLALIEGGVANEDNVRVLRALRANATVLIAVGACAINGGIPAMRNGHSLTACLEESYRDGLGLARGGIPDDAELPMLLGRVHPIHEVVAVDASLPGCPPSADVIWQALSEILAGRAPRLAPDQIHYD